MEPSGEDCVERAPKKKVVNNTENLLHFVCVGHYFVPRDADGFAAAPITADTPAIRVTLSRLGEPVPPTMIDISLSVNLHNLVKDLLGTDDFGVNVKELPDGPSPSWSPTQQQ
jgi:hypothetical protein